VKHIDRASTLSLGGDQPMRIADYLMWKRGWGVTLALTAMLAPARPAESQTTSSGTGFRVDTIATGLGIVRSMVFISADTALAASHSGQLHLLNVRTGQRVQVTNAPPTVNRGEAGYLDLALHPSFATNRQVFLSMVVGGTPPRNTPAVMRFRLHENSVRDTVTLIRTAAWDTSSLHYGGQLVPHDGHLFISIGDRYARQYPQDMDAHNGKILRIGFDGSVPADNPFAGRPGVRPEIWSFGHRNPQGLAYDSATGIMWETEHGPRHGDELNRIERGRDYGWPRVSWGWEYEGGAIGGGIPGDSATPAPPWVWSPNAAPAGMHVYSGKAFPDWTGNILVGTMQSLRGQGLVRMVWNGSRISLVEFLFTGQLGRVRFVTEDSNGWIYVGNDTGQVLRLRPGTSSRRGNGTSSRRGNGTSSRRGKGAD
jgi:glucose/arabinose dehydrogenase